ncbi:hypothetical protein RUM43_011349 [Polyplax serrata]|uniref:Uncharacterized protein n=1 Tax=Polyplax serrata TaxID=468196 RepID=A0AAN8S7U5_POLSC
MCDSSCDVHVRKIRKRPQRVTPRPVSLKEFRLSNRPSNPRNRKTERPERIDPWRDTWLRQVSENAELLAVRERVCAGGVRGVRDETEGDWSRNNKKKGRRRKKVFRGRRASIPARAEGEVRVREGDGVEATFPTRGKSTPPSSLHDLIKRQQREGREKKGRIFDARVENMETGANGECGHLIG